MYAPHGHLNFKKKSAKIPYCAVHVLHYFCNFFTERQMSWLVYLLFFGDFSKLSIFRISPAKDISLNKIYIKTRMTTFIKTKFKKSDDHTNIDKYRVLANITEYHIMSKLIFLRINHYVT